MFADKRKIKIVTIALVALSLILFSWNKFYSVSAQTPQLPAAVEVEVIMVKKSMASLTQELPGRVSAFRISDVRPQVDGIIRKQLFVEGSFVKQGQPLYQIEPELYRIAYNSAKENYKALSAKKERYKALLEADAVSKQEYEDLVASAAQAEADYKRAQTNLTYAEVRAPISGYIGKSNITEGMLLTSNQTQVLTTITQLDPLYIDMSIPSRNAVNMDEQREIPVTLKINGRNLDEEGVLKIVEVFANQSTDSVRLRAKFSNKNKKLIPGMFVTAQLHLKPIEAITVPQKATTRGPDGSLIVWLVDKENIAKPRPIKAEKTNGDNWIVSEGLEEGDVIIYEGFQKISDGAKVIPLLSRDGARK